jgi:hypothetical protein
MRLLLNPAHLNAFIAQLPNESAPKDVLSIYTPEPIISYKYAGLGFGLESTPGRTKFSLLKMIGPRAICCSVPEAATLGPRDEGCIT